LGFTCVTIAECKVRERAQLRQFGETAQCNQNMEYSGAEAGRS